MMTVERKEASEQEIHALDMGDFAELDRLLEETVAEPNGLPGAVLVALNRKGADSLRACPLRANSEFQGRLFIQCVEKGLLNLDEPIGNILPEYLEPKILRGYTAEDKPILKKAQCYDLFDERLVEWSKKTGRKDNQQSSTLEGFKYPLLFEPGFGYVYSAGLDWAGQMVTNPPSINQSAWGLTKPPEGSLAPGTHQPRDIGADICSGGSGLYGTGTDYIRVLADIINDGGILLRPETVKEMFRPQLPDARYLQEAFNSSFASPMRMAPNWDNPTAAVQYGLSFLLNVHETSTGRAAGSAQWSGAANTYWWADYKKGIAGVVMAQTLPFGDQRVIELYKAFETAVYKNADKV
ncbi:uncharacterized protein PAC_00178 [Phialocephala subalpina]|uniref:Beta-lactamase-related domain-containing protein n=1 Tax=Phialocephala subalpina TaxID=576137 RepID=A0A1L7WC03_9HELO|nr:uncharacterized protein PAC_00178 [Phialocephala subalpina]